VSQSGPRLLFTAVLALLLLVPVSSVAQSAANQPGKQSFDAFFPTANLVQYSSVGLFSEPIWNDGGWNKRKKTPPTHVPEGGSTAMYLSLAGFACLAAIARKKRQASE
jgi:hypothetical protein